MIKTDTYKKLENTFVHGFLTLDRLLNETNLNEFIRTQILPNLRRGSFESSSHTFSGDSLIPDYDRQYFRDCIETINSRLAGIIEYNLSIQRLNVEGADYIEVNGELTAIVKSWIYDYQGLHQLRILNSSLLFIRNNNHYPCKDLLEIFCAGFRRWRKVCEYGSPIHNPIFPLMTSRNYLRHMIVTQKWQQDHELPLHIHEQGCGLGFVGHVDLFPALRALIVESVISLWPRLVAESEEVISNEPDIILEDSFHEVLVDKVINATPLKKLKLGFVRTNQSALLEDILVLHKQYQLPEEEVRYVIAGIDLVLELYYSFGLVPHSLTDFSKIKSLSRRKAIFRANSIRYKSVHKLLLFVSKNGSGSWVKFWKWKLPSFFAFRTKQDPVPRPALDFGHGTKLDALFRPDILLGGICHDFFCSLKKEDREDFLASCLILKKGFPRPPKSFVDASLDDTVKTLTSPPSPTLVEDAEEIKQEIEWVVDSVFKDAELTSDDVYTPVFPSTSACYKRSVAKGGSAMELAKIIFQSRLWNYQANDPTEVLIGKRMVEYFGEQSMNYGHFGKLDQLKKDFARFSGITEQGSLDVFDFSDFKMNYKELYNSLFRLAKDEENIVKPVGLLEALKVRVITKGPVLRGYVLKMFQKFLFKQLRKFEIFRFIGEPLNLEKLEPLLKKLDDNSYFYLDEVPEGMTVSPDFPLDCSYFISGDYKASTDNLKSWISNHIVNRIFVNLEENFKHGDFPKMFLSDLRQLVIAALTGHLVEYKGERKPQQNGQLMGSIVSFPILCLANAALCSLTIRKNRERQGLRSLNFRSLPMYINGDDCLLLGSGIDFKQTWLRLGVAFGLENSVGKTYFSNSLVTLNSLCFFRTGKSWRQTQVVNFGLLYGYKRSSESLESPGIGSLGVLAQKLLEPFERESLRYKYLHRRFLEQHRETLKNTRLSWFAPQWSGGLGIPGSVSDLDRVLVSVIRQRLAHKVVPVKEAVSWETHQLILNKYGAEDCPFEGYLDEHLDSISVIKANADWERGYDVQSKFTKGGRLFENEYASIYSICSVLLYLHSTCFENGKIFSPKKDKDRNNGAEVARAVKRNEKVWDHARKLLNSTQIILIKDDELENEPKRFFPAWGQVQSYDYLPSPLIKGFKERLPVLKEIILGNELGQRPNLDLEIPQAVVS